MQKINDNQTRTFEEAMQCIKTSSRPITFTVSRLVVQKEEVHNIAAAAARLKAEEDAVVARIYARESEATAAQILISEAQATRRTVTFASEGEGEGEGGAVVGPLGMTLRKHGGSGRAVVSVVAKGGVAQSKGVWVLDCIEVGQKSEDIITATTLTAGVSACLALTLVLLLCNVLYRMLWFGLM